MCCRWPSQMGPHIVISIKHQAQNYLQSVDPDAINYSILRFVEGMAVSKGTTPCR